MKQQVHPAAPATGVSALPRHVAIIMDGNGRWAEARGLSRLDGHRAGYENVRRVVRILGEARVEYVTLFAFSTENWSRPQEEVEGLLELAGEVIRAETEELHRANVRIRHLGRVDRLGPTLRGEIGRAVELTERNMGLNLNVAFDYGGRADIVQAVKRLVEDGVGPDQIDEELFSRYLFTDGLPDPDLVIRTGGEFRISNFLLWQSAYSEFHSTPVNWPDFGAQQVEEAFRAYGARKRRFGRVG